MTLIQYACRQLLTKLPLPLFADRIPAGFPSPAQGEIEQALDLNELCIQHPTSTFFVRVQGDSMTDAGIFNNDVLVVDRSLQAQHGDIVIAALYGEFTVKQLALRPKLQLIPRNLNYPPIEVRNPSDLELFGVVTNVVRSLKKH